MNTDKMIFVFGSNLSGIHGAGAARYALDRRGAVWGLPEGPMNQSYAIPTKDRFIKRLLPYGSIQEAVRRFCVHADNHPDQQFQITQIGCGLAGGDPRIIAPMFKDAPRRNCFIDSAWKEYLPNHLYWGTL